MQVRKPSSTALLRNQKREQRRALSLSEQTDHAVLLLDQVRHHPRFLSSKRIACYLSNDGEIDPVFVIEQAWRQNKQVYLPVLSPFRNNLYFAPFHANSPMSFNRYGIMEPSCHPNHWIKARHIDLMLVPLVAFDANGNRLGMGGGFYDRSLAHRRAGTHIRKPYLLGLAHELQKTEALLTQHWDIPLDAIATEQRIYRTK